MVSHLGKHATLVPVRNMDRAVKFYTESLGGKLLHRMEGEMKDFWASVQVGGSEFWLVSPEEREKRELAYSVFMVDDVKGAVSELKKKGVKFNRGEKMGKESRVEGPITFDPTGATAFFKDSEGNLLMLFQGMSA
ncbi:MAG TPA: VOC family protein [Nitrososphaerales archaeon]|nr:VOC family protein [Nitrososphaerales archaeon]